MDGDRKNGWRGEEGGRGRREGRRTHSHYSQRSRSPPPVDRYHKKARRRRSPSPYRRESSEGHYRGEGRYRGSDRASEARDGDRYRHRQRSRSRSRTPPMTSRRYQERPRRSPSPNLNTHGRSGSGARRIEERSRSRALSPFQKPDPVRSRSPYIERYHDRPTRSPDPTYHNRSSSSGKQRVDVRYNPGDRERDQNMLRRPKYRQRSRSPPPLDRYSDRSRRSPSPYHRPVDIRRDEERYNGRGQNDFRRERRGYNQTSRSTSNSFPRRRSPSPSYDRRAGPEIDKNPLLDRISLPDRPPPPPSPLLENRITSAPAQPSHEQKSQDGSTIQVPTGPVARDRAKSPALAAVKEIPQNPFGYSDQILARLAKSGVSEGTLLALQPSEGGFNRVSQVGEGTYGKVYKALVRESGTLVAMKRIRMESEKDGFPVTAMREIKLLQSLSHPAIVGLHEIMVGRGSVYMVFEYMDHDLTGVLSHPTFRFSPGEIKSLAHQLFDGLAYLHKNAIIHRDIKGSNILLNNLGELKLADFGLARLYEKRKEGNYTNRVITLWYRPPELLLGLTNYGPEVDNWSAGCILLELFTRRPVFQGINEIEQLEVIYKYLGTPTLEEWPDLMECPWYELVRPTTEMRPRFEEAFSKYLNDDAAQALIKGLLMYDPKQRLTASQVLEDRYFRELPEMVRPQTLTELKGEWHELEAKHRKKKAKELEARKVQDSNADALANGTETIPTNLPA